MHKWLCVQVDRIADPVNLMYKSNPFCTIFNSWVWRQVHTLSDSSEDYNSCIAVNLTESSKLHVLLCHTRQPKQWWLTPHRSINEEKEEETMFFIFSVPDIIIVSEQKITTALINATGTSDLCNFTQVHGGSVFISNIKKKGILLHRN